MKRLPLTVCLLILLLAAPVMAAADCPALVQQALAATDSVCQTTGQNQACYGNMRLQAKPNAQVTDFIFEQPGDRVPLRDIQSLELSPMTLGTGEWGVALMHIQANLPATASKNVMLLAFGDVAIENIAPQPTATDVVVSGQDAVNVRWLPTINSRAVGVLQPGQRVTAIERLPDSSWLRIDLPDSGETGWVKGDLLESLGDLRTLNVTAGDQPNYRPMQAFTFTSGGHDQKCAEIPKDGLLIQTPEGVGEIRLWINQVVVKMGSTVYFQAKPGEDMVISTLEGHATIEALGVTHTAVAGTSVRIALDDTLKPISPPSLPEAYPLDEVQHLPVQSLERDIVIHEPLTDEAVAIVQQQQQEQDTTTATTVTDAVAATVDTAANTVETVVNNTVDTADETVTTVGNTVDDVVTVVTGDDTGGSTGGNSGGDTGTNDGDGSGADDSGDGLISGILDTVLDLPCFLLSCK